MPKESQCVCVCVCVCSCLLCGTWQPAAASHVEHCSKGVYWLAVGRYWLVDCLIGLPCVFEGDDGVMMSAVAACFKHWMALESMLVGSIVSC